jgi:hypothetical protein
MFYPGSLAWNFWSHRESVRKCLLMIYLIPSCFMLRRLMCVIYVNQKGNTNLSFTIFFPLPLLRLSNDNTTQVTGATHSPWAGGLLALPLAAPCLQPDLCFLLCTRIAPCCSGWLCCLLVSHWAWASPPGMLSTVSSSRDTEFLCDLFFPISCGLGGLELEKSTFTQHAEGR